SSRGRSIPRRPTGARGWRTESARCQDDGAGRAYWEPAPPGRRGNAHTRYPKLDSWVHSGWKTWYRRKRSVPALDPLFPYSLGYGPRNGSAKRETRRISILWFSGSAMDDPGRPSGLGAPPRAPSRLALPLPTRHVKVSR